MRPLKLTMQAFGSYGNKTVIDFTKLNQNLFLVTGDTGSGKSTIFDAIVFALYGETSSTRNKKAVWNFKVNSQITIQRHLWSLFFQREKEEKQKHIQYAVNLYICVFKRELLQRQ